MEDGPPRFPPGFTCPVVLRYRIAKRSISVTGLSPSAVQLSSQVHLSNRFNIFPALQPRTSEEVRFGLDPVRSPLLGVSLLISFPLGTEMFHFPRFAPHSLCIQLRVTRIAPRRVSPFGHLRIKACLSAPRSISSTCHVLHRLLAPRHSPCALSNLASAQG